MPNLDGGLCATVGSATSYDEPMNWPESSGFAVSGDLRMYLSEGSGMRPYFGIGYGWYGELGDITGWKACIGLRGLDLGRTSLRLEGGTVGGVRQIEGDRPGLAYLALRVGVDLN
jgi:hypothetical protein